MEGQRGFEWDFIKKKRGRVVLFLVRWAEKGKWAKGCMVGLGCCWVVKFWI